MNAPQATLWFFRDREPTKKYDSSTGTFWMFSVRPGVIITWAVGHITVNQAEGYMETLKSYPAPPGGNSFIHDWSAVTGYEPRVRSVFTDWLLVQPKGSIREVSVLTGSKIVAMGVQTAAMLVRFAGILVQGTTQRSEWEMWLKTRLESAH